MKGFARHMIGIWLLTLSAIATSASVTLTWDEPTENENGTPLTDLASYEIHSGCTIPGAYDRVDTLSAPATAYIVENIFGDTCYFAAIAVNSGGVKSLFSNEAIKILADLPDPPSSLSITWTESEGNELAFGYTGGAFNTGNSASASVTHGLTINSGDLVVAYINSNSTTAVSADAGGTTFTDAANEVPTSETARQALFWKIAGASEPASYSFTVGSANWQVFVKVFTSANDAVVDAAARTQREATSATTIVAGAIDTQVISDNAVSVIFGGKDNRRGSTELYTVADNSYVGILGDAAVQMAAGAHRIYTTGETFSGTVTIETADANDSRNDRTYSIHMSFVEGGGGGTTYNESFSSPLDLTYAAASIANRQGPMSGQMDLATTLSAALISPQSVSEDVDFSEVSAGSALINDSMSEQIDFADTETGLIGQISSISGQIDLATSMVSVIDAALAIEAAVEFGELWAFMATAIAETASAVDFDESLDGGNSAIQATIIADIALSEAFATELIFRSDFSGVLDVSEATDTVLQAIGNVTDVLDLSDIQTALIDAGMSFSDAIDLSEVWSSLSGEIAAAVHIIVAARDRRFVAGPRERLMVVKSRPRRTIVKKLH